MPPKVKFNTKNKSFTTNIVMESNKYTNPISLNSIYPNINTYAPEYKIYTYKLRCIVRAIENINIKERCMSSVCTFYEIDEILIKLNHEKVFDDSININLTFLKHKMNNQEFRRLIDELEDIKNDPRNFINIFNYTLKSLIGERYYDYDD
jgi:hypothetical protein